MGGISLFELALIAIIAMLILGPDKTVGVLYHLGRMMGKARKLLRQYQHELGLDDVGREVNVRLNDFSSAIKTAQRRVSGSVEETQNESVERKWTMPPSPHRLSQKELLEKRIQHLETEIVKLQQRQSRRKPHGHLKVRGE